MSAIDHVTINTLRKRKEMLQSAVAQEVAEFERATGLAVVAFDIDRLTCTSEDGDEWCSGITVRAAIEPINL